jgi:hypothetical protein
LFADQNGGASTMKVRILATLFLVLVALPALAIELATTITKTGNTVRLESVGYTKLSLLKEEVTLTGSIISTGKLSVTGTANIVMWVKVEDRYYFSKLPALQNVKDRKDMGFVIPFNASNKTATEVIIEVELLDEGSVSISDVLIKNG